MTLPDWRTPVAKLRSFVGRNDPYLQAVEDACSSMEEMIGELTMQPKRLKSKGGSRFPKRRNKPYRDWIKGHDCAVRTHGVRQSDCGTRPNRYKIEAAHVETKNSGGYDRGNLLPLCPKHHDEQEGHIGEFQDKYGMDLPELAHEFTEMFDQELVAG